jgi:hypothetical protein
VLKQNIKYNKVERTDVNEKFNDPQKRFHKELRSGVRRVFGAEHFARGGQGTAHLGESAAARVQYVERPRSRQV